jgi:hypothetical protein
MSLGTRGDCSGGEEDPAGLCSGLTEPGHKPESPVRLPPPAELPAARNAL